MSARPDSETTRLHNALRAHLRQEFVAPAAAIVGFADIVIEDAEQAGLAEYRTDLDRVRSAGLRFGFDALSGDIVDVQQSGIVDAAKVLRVALEKAASTAVMILTTGALVLPKKPKPAASKDVP